MGSKIYRITLEDADEVRRTGWLRLGRDWVEFRLIPDNRDRYRDSSYEIGPIRSASERFAPVSVPRDPMWDRWLDG